MIEGQFMFLDFVELLAFDTEHPAADYPLDGALAFGAVLDRLFGHPLELLEAMSAVHALIFIGSHRFLPK